MFTLVLTPRADKALSSFPQDHQTRIRNALGALSFNPFFGKKLEGEFRGKYSFRVWPYRVIYILEKKQKRIMVVSIRHRQSAYQ